MSAKTNGKWISKEKRIAFYLRDSDQPEGLTCCCCGKSITPGAAHQAGGATLGHKEPRAISGLNFDTRIINLVAQCGPCNFAQGDMPWEAFLATLAPEVADMARARDAERMSRNKNWTIYWSKAKALCGL